MTDNLHKHKIPSVSFSVSRDSASRRLSRRRAEHSVVNCRKVSQNTSMNAICHQQQWPRAISTTIHQHQTINNVTCKAHTTYNLVLSAESACKNIFPLTVSNMPPALLHNYTHFRHLSKAYI